MLHLLFLGLPVIVAGGPAQLPAIPDWENAAKFELVASQSPVRPEGPVRNRRPRNARRGLPPLRAPEEAPPTATVVELVEGGAFEGGEPAYPDPIRRDLSGLGEYDLYEARHRDPDSGRRNFRQGSGGGGSSGPLYQLCTDNACSAPTPARRWNSSSPWKGRGARCGNCIQKSSESPSERGEESSDERGHEQGWCTPATPAWKKQAGPVREAFPRELPGAGCALACTAGSPPSTA